MGMFDFLKVCLFSEVNGVVTQDGKPIAGAEIIRTAEFNNKAYIDSTMTDTHGRYYFNARFINSINKILPIEPRVPQKISIRYHNKEYLGWDMDKRDYEINGEIDRKLDLVCELSKEPEMKKLGISGYVDGICDAKE